MLILNLLLSSFAAFAVTFVTPDKNVATYSAATPHFVPVTAATDMCEIFGSASKIIEITSIQIASNQTSAGTNQFWFVKRSSANSGGAYKIVTPVPFDSGFGAATASVKYYTGATNPTVGSSAGTLFIQRVLSGISTSILNPMVEVLRPENTLQRPIVLRGAGQGVAVNFNGATIPSGLTVSCQFIWIERK